MRIQDYLFDEVGRIEELWWW